jgi:exosortase family protein XrtM
MSIPYIQFNESRVWVVIHIAAFIIVFFTLQMLYQNCRGTPIEHVMIDQMTVTPSAQLISWLTPQEGIVARGHSLISRHVHLSVQNGCEGTEAILMLASAILVFPRGWKSKLSGIVVGGLLIYALNQARIVGLYYCLRFDRSLFELLHSYIAPTLVIAMTGLYFIYWVSGAEPQQAA